MLPTEAEPIPEKISAVDYQLMKMTGLENPRPSFIEFLRKHKFEVYENRRFDFPGMPDEVRQQMPVDFGTVYNYEEVQLPWYTVDPRLREKLIAAKARLEFSRPTDVMFIYQGGQKGRQRGGMRAMKQYGPLIVSASVDDAELNLQKVILAYGSVLKETLDEIPVNENAPFDASKYNETIFEEAVNRAMGVQNTERSRIPVGILSLPGNDDSWIPVAWYFPDSQAVVSMDGHLLPYETSDGKTRAAIPWHEFESNLS